MNRAASESSSFIISGATAFATAVYFLALPALARVYSLAEFGRYGTYSAILAMLGTVLTLRLEAGIPVAKTPSIALDLATLGYLITIASAVCWPVVFSGISHTELGKAVVLAGMPTAALAFGLAAQGGLQVATHVGIREGRFRSIALTKVTQSVGQVVTQVLTAAMGLGGAGLILGDVAGRLLAAIGLIRTQQSALVATSSGTLKQSFRAFAHLPLQIAPATFLTMVACQLPLLGIPVLFGHEAAGQYFLAYRITYMPALLFAAGAAPVLLGHIGGLTTEDAQERAVKTAALRLARFAIPVYALAFVSIPFIVPRLLGTAWQGTESIAQMFMPAAAASSIAGPLASVMVVKARGGEALMFSAAELLSKVGCLALAAWVGSFEVALWLLAGTGLVLCCVSIARFIRVAGLRSPQGASATSCEVAA